MLLSQVKDQTINVKKDGHCKHLKLLDVTVDSDLTFRPHIQEICKNASTKVGALLRLQNLLPTNSKLHLYKYVILPTSTYCHQVGNVCTKSDGRKVERIQERTFRIVFKDKSATCDELLKKAGLMTLYNVRLQDLATLMYKVKHKLTPTYIQNMFEENGTKY